jgi:hypothetical protein
MKKGWKLDVCGNKKKIVCTIYQNDGILIQIFDFQNSLKEPAISSQLVASSLFADYVPAIGNQLVTYHIRNSVLFSGCLESFSLLVDLPSGKVVCDDIPVDIDTELVEYNNLPLLIGEKTTNETEIQFHLIEPLKHYNTFSFGDNLLEWLFHASNGMLLCLLNGESGLELHQFSIDPQSSIHLVTQLGALPKEVMLYARENVISVESTMGSYFYEIEDLKIPGPLKKLPLEITKQTSEFETGVIDSLISPLYLVSRYNGDITNLNNGKILNVFNAQQQWKYEDCDPENATFVFTTVNKIGLLSLEE